MLFFSLKTSLESNEEYAKDYEFNFLFAKTCYNLLYQKNYEEISSEKLKEYFLQSNLKVLLNLEKAQDSLFRFF